MSSRRPCVISGCPNPWAKRNNTRTDFCSIHLGRLERNRAKGMKPVRALTELRVELFGLSAAVLNAPTISTQDWSAFLGALRDYRAVAIDKALHPATRKLLDEMGPFERRVVMRRIIEVTAKTNYGDVLDLELVGDGKGRWTVELREHIAWSP